MTAARKLVIALLVSATAACHDNVSVGPPDGPLSHIRVSYVCGNEFDLANQSPHALSVHYAVRGTAEDGELVLPPASDAAESTTRLTTIQHGSLLLALGDEELFAVENGDSMCPPPADAPEQSVSGEWSPPFPWPIVAVHLHLLPDGRVLSWGRLGSPQVWEPATGQFTEVATATMVFCSGHTFLPDGRLLVTGGHLDDRRGLRDANIFDASITAWASAPRMSSARWYPTSTTLPTGEVVTLAGTDETAQDVPVPEVWSGSSWRSLSGAAQTLPYYPRTFVAPNGLVFYAGELPQSAYLDPSGAGKWIPAGTSNYGRRDYGSAVMYQPGKVMIVGGSDPPDGQPTNTAEVIDLNQSVPSWRYTDPMSRPRRQLNASLLPDGQVLVTGGTSSPGFSDRNGAVRSAEIWNPETQKWRVLASGEVIRVYHSSTILLPDGRVLHAGSGDGPGLPRELNAELFSPPYLFQGPRPVMTAAPTEVGYGERFFVASPDAARVVRVTLIRLPSVTHAFDQSQRFVELGLRRTGGGLTITAPSSPNAAPPGPYLLFLLNSAGIPSLARMVRVG